jgi:porin
MKANSPTVLNSARVIGLAAMVAPAFLAQPGFAAPEFAEASSYRRPSEAAASGKQTAPAPEAAKGLLPIPDYSGDLWSRSFLSGDWGGTRTDWANKGIQFGLNWNQWLQGVADGGLDRTTQYGGLIDYTLNLDLMRMGVMPGALVRIRAASRYGNSVNGSAGSILPVNTAALFPLTAKLDEDVPFTITDFNYTQFLSEQFGVIVGKANTLDADVNEFASGRGTSQFMNGNFLFNPAVALRLPYSTLGAGVIWMPKPPGPDGGITVTSMILNTADSSTSTGFDDFGKGVSWTGEADFQYRVGDLPGGMNVGFLYSFDQDFAHLNSRLIFQPGEGLVIPNEDSTWAVYWSGWQYLYSPETEKRPIDLMDGRPDQKGIGVFARFGFADRETNPVEWAVSGGIGGRGLIPSRDNDTFGIGGYYNSIQGTRLFSALGVENSTSGFEAFYNIQVTPACHVTLDVQVINPVSTDLDTATIFGVRAGFVF